MSGRTELAEHGAAEIDLKDEQRRILRASTAAFVLCAVVLGTAHFLLPRLIKFPPGDLEIRLKFWASASLFVIVWVMIGVGMVWEAALGARYPRVGLCATKSEDSRAGRLPSEHP